MYVILPISGSAVSGDLLLIAHDKEDEGAGRCHTTCWRSLAGAWYRPGRSRNLGPGSCCVRANF